MVMAHNLVMTHFVPNPDKKKFPNHKNLIRNDNRVNNLEWCTHQENIQHSYRENKNRAAKKYRKPMTNVRKMVFDSIDGKEYASVAHAARSIGVAQDFLSRCLNGLCKNNTTLSFKKTA
jgi:hypothetical protein